VNRYRTTLGRYVALSALGSTLILTGCPTDEVAETPTDEPTTEATEATPDAEPATDEQAATTRTPPEAFLELADDAYTATETGLKFHDMTVGTGDSPEDGSIVIVDYTGWLEDGTSFDSSLKRPDPFKFVLGKGQVIKGWDEGVAGMKVGGERQLWIPFDLAYGERGRPPRIPAEAPLIFQVKLIEIMPPRMAPEAPQQVAETDYTVTESGLKYHDFEVGTGDAAVEGKLVKVEYSGWLEDGTMFDSSFRRTDPIQFPLGRGRVIPGWDEGVGSMKVGGKRQLWIPYALAYGDQGRPPTIPAAANLIFEVELVHAQQQ
jgi:peptidylprolyl isomerase